MTTTVKKMKYERNEKGEYICSHEGCGFTAKPKNASTMHYHMKKHMGALTHVCDCGKAFVQKSGLQQHHIQIHGDGGRFYDCPWCEHSCKMKPNLLIHIGRKHGSEWIRPMIQENTDHGSCTECKKTFTSVTAYYYHAVQCFTPPDIVAEKLATIV